MNDETNSNLESTAQKLEKQFDALSADLNELMRRHRRFRDDREALLEVCKRALPYLASHVALTPDAGPGDRLVYDAMVEAIANAEIPIV